MYPTVSYGEACTNLGEPYIGKCNYDGAGFALKALYGELKPSVAQIPANLMQFDQTKFASNAKSLSLNSIGYIYVPTSCQQGATCSLHVRGRHTLMHTSICFATTATATTTTTTTATGLNAGPLTGFVVGTDFLPRL